MPALRSIKNLIVSNEVKPRRVLSGAFRGLRMHLNPAFATQAWIGLSEREVHRSLRQLTRNIRAGVDIGAAQGEYALFLLARTPAEKVIAVEPLPDEYNILLQNLKINDECRAAGRFELVPRTIGSKAWERELTLDDLVADLPRPLFVKIDADFSELDILESGPRAVADQQIRWLIETHRNDLEDSCVAIFRARGRKVRVIRNAWWRRIVPEQRVSAHNRWFVVE